MFHHHRWMLQVSQISRKKSRLCRQQPFFNSWISIIPAVPGSACARMCLIGCHKSLQGLPTWEHALDRLLARAETMNFAMNLTRRSHRVGGVLYEGYPLIPTVLRSRSPALPFGGIYPEAYCQPAPTATVRHQTECLGGEGSTTVDVVIRSSDRSPGGEVMPSSVQIMPTASRPGAGGHAAGRR
jgi:hypothetical protein